MTLPEYGGIVRERTVDLAHEWARRAVLEITRKTGRQAAPQSAFRSEPDLHIAASDIDAIARIEAAAELRLAARQLTVGYARCARGAGISWQQIGAALSSELLTGSGAAAADGAFGYVADTTAFGQPVFAWVCRACRSTIIDHGPRRAPDGEDGHASTCPRLAAGASQEGEPG